MTCEPLITVTEAAALIGVSKKTVTRMAVNGEVPAMRVGKFWKFRASMLDGWMVARIQSSNPSRPSQGSV